MHRGFSAQLVFDWNISHPLTIRAEGIRWRPKLVAISEYQKRMGETHHKSTISDATVERIRELHERFGMGYRTIAKALELPVWSVKKIYTYERRASTVARWKRDARKQVVSK